MSDLATDLHMISIDKVLYLRSEMRKAVTALMDGQPIAALGVLQTALDETDVGAMKVWQPGEEPF